MAYIYLYSATDKADIREFTSPLILFMVIDEDENYCCEMAWGLFSLASGRARGPARETPSRISPAPSQWREMLNDMTQIIRYVLPCQESVLILICLTCAIPIKWRHGL